jgi:glucokinase
MSQSFILALDYGGTKLSAAITGVGQTTWSALLRHSSPQGHDAAYEQRVMIELARELLRGREAAAIGVSFGGPVLQAKGLVQLSHHIPGWENTPLAGRLQSEFGVPVAVANDANAGALGEWRYGAGQGCASVFYVTVSTGVGGGWVLGGTIWDGADGMAGELGHVVVRPGGAPCVCGKRGCVEVEACGTAIARAAREQIATRPEAASALLALAGSAEAVTAVHVAQAGQTGDALACAVLDDAAGMLGAGIGSAINLINPERVIVGGGVTKSGERWWRGVREAARAHALPQMRVDIRAAALGDDAPLWGAVALGENLIAR